MSQKTTDEAVQEILQRTIRVETRMLQLGDHVGANLRTKQRIEIARSGDARHAIVAYVDSLDVSLSRVLAEIKDSAYWHDDSPHGAHVITVDIRLGTPKRFQTVGSVNLPGVD